MVLPNFLIIGAAKSGTTALHSYLQQHPQIYMTPEKETNFFAFEGEELCFQGPGDEAINHFSITDLDSYEAEFNGVIEQKAMGEACPLYLYHPEACHRIKNYIPEVRIIVILRHPVQRAYANFLHLIRDDREPISDFYQALKLESERIKKNWEWFWHYVQLGYYGKQLERYYNIFAPEKIKVYLYEDLRDNPEKLLTSIFDFLEVNPNFVPEMSIRPNKSGMPKNTFVHQLLTKPNPIKSFLKPLFPVKMRQKIQHYNLTSPEISSDAREFLIQSYRQDILMCQDLIHRDLSAWLK